LVDKANATGGHDNITAILYEHAHPVAVGSDIERN
jgi:serine/threonine protein phosphatase PrpC